jgi:hypothetical protein
MNDSSNPISERTMAKLIGVSPKTLYNWRKQLIAKGLFSDAPKVQEVTEDRDLLVSRDLFFLCAFSSSKPYVG